MELPSIIDDTTIVLMFISFVIFIVLIGLLTRLIIQQYSFLSVNLTIQFATALLSCALPLPYIGYVLCTFQGTGTLYSKHHVFWSSTFYFSFYPALSVSILFLALDRILTITVFIAHMRTTRMSLAICNVFSQFLIYFFVVYKNSAYAPDTATQSECVSYGCAGTSPTSQNSTFLWMVNLPIVFTNVILGCTFYFLYSKRQNAKIARANKKVNQIAISAVMVEFFLKVTPYGLSYIITKITGANLPKLLGPYFIYFHVAEIGSLVFVYYKQLRTARFVSQSGGKAQSGGRAGTIVVHPSAGSSIH